MKLWATLLLGMLSSSAAFAQNTGFEIQVLSAVIKDQVIDGSQVLLQRNGWPTTALLTGPDGRPLPSSQPRPPDDADTLLIVRKEGYSPLIIPCPCNRLTYALSPVMGQLDALRIVLSWTALSGDLDAHLAYAGTTASEAGYLWHRNREQAGSRLDVDDRHGSGPETITVEDRQRAGRMVYAVHDFVETEDGIARARPFVAVYVGQTLVRRFQASARRRGDMWLVFEISEAGVISTLDRYETITKDSIHARMAFALGNTKPPQPTASSRNVESARLLNSNGETAYRDGNYDAATQLFQRAIELDEEFGQAYSNLGLVFDRTGREAEALWANRQAIERARGAAGSRVRASSHFNIARIYEQRSQWADALSHYRLAQSQQARNVYVEAIKRMELLLSAQ